MRCLIVPASLACGFLSQGAAAADIASLPTLTLDGAKAVAAAATNYAKAKNLLVEGVRP